MIMQAGRHRQRGVTLTGVIVVGILLALLAAAGMKVLPDVMDYFTVLKDVKATAQDPTLRDATVAEIRRSFERRLQIDAVSGIDSSDLDISKQGTDIVISFAYTKKIPLLRNVSLVVDFEGSTAGK